MGWSWLNVRGYIIQDVILLDNTLISGKRREIMYTSFPIEMSEISIIVYIV